MINMYDNILKIKEIALTLEESNAMLDQELSRISILFPLFEALGYDSIKEGDITINPKFTEDGTYSMDYGLRDEKDNTIKTFVKVVDYNFDLSLEQSAINKNLSSIHADKFIVITDCYKYKIFQAGTHELDEIITFSMKELTPDIVKIIGLLQNPLFLFQLKDGNSDNNVDTKQEEQQVEDEEHIEFQTPIEPYVYKPRDTQTIKTKKIVNVKTLIGCVLICIGLLSVVLSTVLALKHINNPNNWYSIEFAIKDNELDYHTLTGTLKVSTYQTKLSVINVNFSNSNVPEGSIITFNVTNKNAQTTISKKIVYTGIISDDISIPDTWVDCNIEVNAMLLFDDDQPKQTTEKLGSIGEKIIEVNGYSKEHIATESTYYDSTKIKINIAEAEAALKAQQLKENREYLSNFNIVQTSTGDIWFYPAGYSSDDQDYNNPNITDNKKSYASIKYNQKTNQAQFYYIAGSNMGNKHVSFSSVAGAVILSDGVNSYTLNTNKGVINFFINEYDNVSGWCRYDLNSVSGLFGILRAVYSSSQPTIQFKGITTEEYISNADKKAVVSIMNLWLKYFNTENINFDTTWIPS